MRFVRRELSPANKRQYLIALGRKDIELLLGEAKAAHDHFPRVQGGELKHARYRLRGIVKGLSEALDQAIKDGDEGERVPVQFRQEYKNRLDSNPLYDITRLEIIDNSGQVYDQTGALMAGKGRTSIFWDKNKMVDSEIQDEGKTMKLFISDRPMLTQAQPPKELENTAEAIVKKVSDQFGKELKKIVKEDETLDIMVDKLVDMYSSGEYTNQEAKNNFKELVRRAKYGRK